MFRSMREGLLAAVLVGVTLIAYSPLRSCDFIDYDDPVYVTGDDSQVRAGLTPQSIAWAWTTTHAANWHPLTWLSLMLDTQLFGTAAWGYHLTNLLLHLANTLLVFALFRRMTGAVYPSALVAALFAVHPLHVESVAWVSERKDVLCAFFGLLAMYAYARYAESPTIGRYLIVALLMILSLLSKPMLVTLPFVLLLLDYWPLEKWKTVGWRRLCLEKLPLLALSAALCPVIMIVQREGHAMMALAHLPWPVRVGNALISYLQYLRQMLLPVDLAPFYPHPSSELSPAAAIACGVLLAAASLAVLALGRRRPYLPVGWFWYLGMLVPVIGLVQVGLQARADRYTYLPLLGIFLMIAWGLAELASRWHLERALAVLAAGIVGCLVLLTQTQVRYWRDPRTLWEHALAVTGRTNGVAHNNLGHLDLLQGNVNSAIAHYREWLRYSPVQTAAHFNLASALIHRGGDMTEAIGHLQTCLRLDPTQAPAHELWADALLRQRRWDEAIQHCREAIALRPDSPRAHFFLGKALMSQERVAEAIPALQEAVRLDPNNHGIRSMLGKALMIQGELNEAIAQLRECVRREPNSAAAHTNLGVALLSHGDLSEAGEQFREAVRLDAKDAPAYASLGLVDLLRQQWESARDYYQRAVALQPRTAAYHYGLAYAQQKLGQKDEARGEYEASLRLDRSWPKAALGKAWMMATAAESSARNGVWAYQTAEQVRQATGDKDAEALDVFAAACAELGRFSEAVKVARQAQDLARAEGRKDLAAAIGERLHLYEKRQPFRDASAKRR